MEQALIGYKVLDFGHYIAGPYAAMLLAEQGAEAIKIEPPMDDLPGSTKGRSLNWWDFETKESNDSFNSDSWKM